MSTKHIITHTHTRTHDIINRPLIRQAEQTDKKVKYSKT